MASYALPVPRFWVIVLVLLLLVIVPSITGGVTIAEGYTAGGAILVLLAIAMLIGAVWWVDSSHRNELEAEKAAHARVLEVQAAEAPRRSEQEQRRLRREELLRLSRQDFQDAVIGMLGGVSNPIKARDFGVDGHLSDGTPIQVTQSPNVPRNKVDLFLAAVLREKRTAGTMVALSYSQGSLDEAERLAREQGVNLTLRTLDEILGLSSRDVC